MSENKKRFFTYLIEHYLCIEYYEFEFIAFERKTLIFVSKGMHHELSVLMRPSSDFSVFSKENIEDLVNKSSSFVITGSNYGDIIFHEFNYYKNQDYGC